MLDQTSPRQIKVIGFDLDNTLYRSTDPMQERNRGKIYELISQDIGIPLYSAQALFEMEYNSTGQPWSSSGSRTVEEIAKRHNRTINGKDLIQCALEQADILDLIQPDPELQKMMLRLFGNYDLDLITGSQQDLALAKLQRLGIPHDLFGHILAGGEYGNKTSGSVYVHWAGLRGFVTDLNRMLYVGDNLRQDIEAPKTLGITTCLVGKKDSKADFCIEKITDLESVL